DERESPDFVFAKNSLHNCFGLFWVNGFNTLNQSNQSVNAISQRILAVQMPALDSPKKRAVNPSYFPPAVNFHAKRVKFTHPTSNSLSPITISAPCPRPAVISSRLAPDDGGGSARRQSFLCLGAR